VVVDATITITKDPAAPQLDGGTLSLEVKVSGQAAYSGVDGWMPVVPPIEWFAGSDPRFLSGVLGKAYVLTTSGAQGARLRVVVTGSDWIDVIVLVAPVVASPSCASP